MNPAVRKYLSDIGRKGGKKSKRSLDATTAKQMTRVRDAKRAYKKFFSQCFWSYDPDLEISESDISWVADQLMKNGNRQAWHAGVRLCR